MFVHVPESRSQVLVARGADSPGPSRHGRSEMAQLGSAAKQMFRRPARCAGGCPAIRQSSAADNVRIRDSVRLAATRGPQGIQRPRRTMATRPAPRIRLDTPERHAEIGRVLSDGPHGWAPMLSAGLAGRLIVGQRTPTAVYTVGAGTGNAQNRGDAIARDAILSVATTNRFRA